MHRIHTNHIIKNIKNHDEFIQGDNGSIVYASTGVTTSHTTTWGTIESTTKTTNINTTWSSSHMEYSYAE